MSIGSVKWSPSAHASYRELDVAERRSAAEPRRSRYAAHGRFGRLALGELEVTDESFVELTSPVDVPVVAALVGNELVC